MAIKSSVSIMYFTRFHVQPLLSNLTLLLQIPCPTKIGIS